MANNPKKVKDPTEVALSAIQEALNISDAAADTNRHLMRDEAALSIPPATPSYGETQFDTRGSSERSSFDARHGVADGRFHHGRAVLDVDGAGFAVMVDKMNFGHDRSCCRIGDNKVGAVL